MVTVTLDIQKLIQLNGDGKADFHLPIVFEKVARYLLNTSPKCRKQWSSKLS